MNAILHAGFGGYFLAMTIVNVIASMLMRSRASAVYCALMTVMAVEELYFLFGRPGGAGVEAAIVVAYLVTSAAFAISLLRVRRHDPTAGWIVGGVLALNVPLVFIEFVLGPAWHFYVVDQLALDALFAALVVLGVRARPREGVIATTYLLGLLGPIVGSIVNDLAKHNVLPNIDALVYTFDAGVAWEAAFFAYAVALRNRGIQAERDRFERLAFVDGLTGVANRRTFDETLVRTWNFTLRAGVPIALLMVDVDHFKRLNDTRGHQVGDECLRRVAALCSSTLRRAGDCFARYGGEEFVAILVNADAEHAKDVAEHMRRMVERDGGMTISVGVAARVPTPADSPPALVADADEALYRAKNEGRNCVRACAPKVYSAG
ncbi:MAG: diguanylate cyclase [Candidatus Eremiobacteraeota bacterium]|nr:diguanylate cyclase [Candidatus Eremiobacteraeota bacterium]MBV8432951.1 diguanylate cyclase [Candidatus Eremiobacteraeota bacterium]MBV8654506.1 diguanylate cyclase [Candidatus Eremiobacteraeota bacterium]